MKHKKRNYISYKDVYSNPIIGYNTNFWNHCLEINKEDIIHYPQNDNLHSLSFRCEKDHLFRITPYEFFNERYFCPICIFGDDKGAPNCDPELSLFYSDERYPLNEISELSRIEYQFTCPDCNFKFASKMVNLIHNPRKCPNCKDYQEKEEAEQQVGIDFKFITLD